MLQSHWWSLSLVCLPLRVSLRRLRSRCCNMAELQSSWRIYICSWVLDCPWAVKIFYFFYHFIFMFFLKPFWKGWCLEVFSLVFAVFISHQQELSVFLCVWSSNKLLLPLWQIHCWLKSSHSFPHPPAGSLFCFLQWCASLTCFLSFVPFPRILTRAPILTVLWYLGRFRSSINANPLILLAISSSLSRSTFVWGTMLSAWWAAFLVTPCNHFSSPGVQHICCVRHGWDAKTC